MWIRTSVYQPFTLSYPYKYPVYNIHEILVLASSGVCYIKFNVYCNLKTCLFNNNSLLFLPK